MLSPWETLLRLLLAALFGSIIGFERERLLWAAGIRTHMLVCVGSCLIMIVSAFGFTDALSMPHVVLDPSRVAAQVVSGIGFIGAGSILLRGQVVRGLTTAASIWTVAAIGLAVGGGLYIASAMSTVAIIVILAGIKPIEEMYRARNQSWSLRIVMERAAITAEALRSTHGLRSGQIKRFTFEASDAAGLDEMLLVLVRTGQAAASRLADQLRTATGVKSVSLKPRRKVVRRDGE